MGRVHGRNATISYNEKDFGGESNRWGITVEQDNAEVTAHGDTAKTFVEGKYGWSVDLTTWYDAAANKSESELVAELGQGTHAMTIAVAGTASSAVRYHGDVFIERFNIDAPVDGAAVLAATFRGTGVLTRATS